MFSLAQTTNAASTLPQTLEALAAAIVLICVVTNAITACVALRRYRLNKVANEPGPLLFAWMQLRLEILLLGAQFFVLLITLHRIQRPDTLTLCGRLAMAVLLAIAVAANRRDFKKL